MRCPKCGAELPDGFLYCEKCGEEIHVVPDYDPTLDVAIDVEGTAEGAEQEITEKKHPAGHRKLRQYALRALIGILTIAVIILIIVTKLNVAHENSATYQIAMAVKYRSIGEYDKAIACYSKAIELEQDDVGLLTDVAEVYYLKNDEAWYEVTLKRVLYHPEATDAQKKWAREMLIPLMIKKGDFEMVYKLLKDSGDDNLIAAYQEYVAPKPSFSLMEGTYEDIQSLTITSYAEGKIYYSMDGTVPGETSKPYTMPIVLDFGTVTIKACLINSYGVKSDVTEATYVIQLPENASK